MNINIKRLDHRAVIPRYSLDGDAAMDLTATSLKFENDCYIYGTGIAIEIPKGYVGHIYPRSSLSKKDLFLSNHVGVIDSNFRGEITFKFKSTASKNVINIYEIGDRIGQLIIIPRPVIEFKEVEELSETNRGNGGYGSTGS